MARVPQSQDRSVQRRGIPFVPQRDAGPDAFGDAEARAEAERAASVSRVGDAQRQATDRVTAAAAGAQQRAGEATQEAVDRLGAARANAIVRSGEERKAAIRRTGVARTGAAARVSDAISSAAASDESIAGAVASEASVLIGGIGDDLIAGAARLTVQRENVERAEILGAVNSSLNNVFTAEQNGANFSTKDGIEAYNGAIQDVLGQALSKAEELGHTSESMLKMLAETKRLGFEFRDLGTNAGISALRAREERTRADFVGAQAGKVLREPSKFSEAIQAIELNLIEAAQAHNQEEVEVMREAAYSAVGMAAFDGHMRVPSISGENFIDARRVLNRIEDFITPEEARQAFQRLVVAEAEHFKRTGELIITLAPGEVALASDGSEIGRGREIATVTHVLKPGEILTDDKGVEIAKGTEVPVTYTLAPGHIVTNAEGEEIAAGKPVAQAGHVLDPGQILVGPDGTEIAKGSELKITFTLRPGEIVTDAEGNEIAKGPPLPDVTHTLRAGERLVDDKGVEIAKGIDEAFILAPGQVVISSDGTEIAKGPPLPTPTHVLQAGEILVENGKEIARGLDKPGEAFVLEPGQIVQNAQGETIAKGPDLPDPTFTLRPGDIVRDAQNNIIAEGAPLAEVRHILGVGQILTDDKGNTIASGPAEEGKTFTLSPGQIVKNAEGTTIATGPPLVEEDILGDTFRGRMNRIILDNTDAFAIGGLNPQEDHMFLLAVTALAQRDPVTGFRTAMAPQVAEALRKRGFHPESFGDPSITQPSVLTDVPQIPVEDRRIEADPPGPPADEFEEPDFERIDVSPIDINNPDIDKVIREAIPGILIGDKTIAELIQEGFTGPGASARSFFGGLPFSRGSGMVDTMRRAIPLSRERVVSALQQNPRFAVLEREQIKENIPLEPSFWSNSGKMLGEVVGLDLWLGSLEAELVAALQTPQANEARAHDKTSLALIQAYRDRLAPHIISVQDPEEVAKQLQTFINENPPETAVIYLQGGIWRISKTPLPAEGTEQ